MRNFLFLAFIMLPLSAFSQSHSWSAGLKTVLSPGWKFDNQFLVKTITAKDDVRIMLVPSYDSASVQTIAQKYMNNLKANSKGKLQPSIINTSKWRNIDVIEILADDAKVKIYTSIYYQPGQQILVSMFCKAPISLQTCRSQRDEIILNSSFDTYFTISTTKDYSKLLNLPLGFHFQNVAEGKYHLYFGQQFGLFIYSLSKSTQIDMKNFLMRFAGDLKLSPMGELNADNRSRFASGWFQHKSGQMFVVLRAFDTGSEWILVGGNTRKDKYQALFSAIKSVSLK